MALNQAVRDMAQKIADDLAEGRPSRTTLGGKGVAFGWTSGLPVTLLSFIDVMQAAGLSVPIARVSASGTPAAKVAAGTPKPLATTITTSDVALPKYAGYSEVQLEQLISYTNIGPAVTNVLGAQILMALESDAMAALAAGKGGTASGATWLAAIAAGQGEILGAGGVPSVIVLSSEDYATAIGEITTSAGFAASPSSAVGEVLGSLLHISPRLAAGKGYVLDSSAVLGIESDQGPLLLGNPYSRATENIVQVVADLFATVAVANPAHIVEITKSGS